ncbi:MAG: hypothetical protein GY822_22170 [Deltaproteobacteria bacterium]|nr:hypothetical protein [Deltaproteobacteria bacterium]
MLANAEIGDPCDGFSCGENGACFALNGFPTCICDSGFGAVIDKRVPSGVKCREVETSFGNNQVVYVDVPALNLNTVGAAISFTAGCAALDLPAMSEFSGLAFLLFALRRSRARRQKAA